MTFFHISLQVPKQELARLEKQKSIIFVDLKAIKMSSVFIIQKYGLWIKSFVVF